MFNTLVKPILTYMSELWGCLKMPKNDPVSTFQTKFLKELLGVNVKTTNTCVFLETGEIPLILFAQKIVSKTGHVLKKDWPMHHSPSQYKNHKTKNILGLNLSRRSYSQSAFEDFFPK